MIAIDNISMCCARYILLLATKVVGSINADARRHASSSSSISGNASTKNQKRLMIQPHTDSYVVIVGGGGQKQPQESHAHHSITDTNYQLFALLFTSVQRNYPSSS